MKTLIAVLFIGIGLSAHAGYKGETLIKWFNPGVTQGVDPKGKPCEVVLTFAQSLGHASLVVRTEGTEVHKHPRFNAFLSNELEKIQDERNSLQIVVRSRPTNNYTSPVRQTLNVRKSSKGTQVNLVEKELRLFGKNLKASCLID